MAAFRIAAGDRPDHGWAPPRSSLQLWKKLVETLENVELHHRGQVAAEELMYRVELRSILQQMRAGSFRYYPPLTTGVGLGLRTPTLIPTASICTVDSSSDTDAGGLEAPPPTDATWRSCGVSAARATVLSGTVATPLPTSLPSGAFSSTFGGGISQGGLASTLSRAISLPPALADKAKVGVAAVKSSAAVPVSPTAAPMTPFTAATAADFYQTDAGEDDVRSACEVSEVDFAPVRVRSPMSGALTAATPADYWSVGESLLQPRPGEPVKSRAAPGQQHAAARADAAQASFQRVLSQVWKAQAEATPPCTPAPSFASPKSTFGVGFGSPKSAFGQPAAPAADEAAFDEEARGSLQPSKRGSWCRVAEEAWQVYEHGTPAPPVNAKSLPPRWKELDARTAMTGWEVGVWGRVNLKGQGSDDLRSAVDLRRESDNRWAARHALEVLEGSLRAEMVCAYFDGACDIYTELVAALEWLEANALYAQAAMTLTWQRGEDLLFARAAEVDRMLEDPGEHGMFWAWVQTTLTAVTDAVEYDYRIERLLSCERIARSAVETQARVAPMEYTHRRYVEEEEAHARAIGECFFLTFRRFLTVSSRTVLLHYRAARSQYRLSQLDEPRCMLAAEIESWAAHAVWMQAEERDSMRRDEAAARCGTEAEEGLAALKLMRWSQEQPAAIAREEVGRRMCYAAGVAAVEREMARIVEESATVRERRRAARLKAARRVRTEHFLDALAAPQRRAQLEAQYGRRRVWDSMGVAASRRRADRELMTARAYLKHRTQLSARRRGSILNDTLAAARTHTNTHTHASNGCFRCHSTASLSTPPLQQTPPSTNSDAAALLDVPKDVKGRAVSLRRMPSPPPRPPLLQAPCVWSRTAAYAAASDSGSNGGDESSDDAGSEWDSDGGGEAGCVARARHAQRLADGLDGFCDAVVAPWKRRAQVDGLLALLHQLPRCVADGVVGIPAAPFAYYASEGFPRQFLKPPRRRDFAAAVEGGGGRSPSARARATAVDVQHPRFAPRAAGPAEWARFRGRRRARSAPVGAGGRGGLWEEYAAGLRKTEARHREHYAGEEAAQRLRLRTVLQRVVEHEAALRRATLPVPVAAPLAADELREREVVVNDCIGDYVVLYELHVHVARSILHANTATPPALPPPPAARTVDAVLADATAPATWAPTDPRRGVRDLTGKMVAGCAVGPTTVALESLSDVGGREAAVELRRRFWDYKWGCRGGGDGGAATRRLFDEADESFALSEPLTPPRLDTARSDRACQADTPAICADAHETVGTPTVAAAPLTLPLPAAQPPFVVDAAAADELAESPQLQSQPAENAERLHNAAVAAVRHGAALQAHGMLARRDTGRSAAMQAVSLAIYLRDEGAAVEVVERLAVAETVARQRLATTEHTARCTLRDVHQEFHQEVLQRDTQSHRYRVLRRLMLYDHEVKAKRTIEARWRDAATLIQKRWRGYRARVIMDQERNSYRYKFVDQPPAPHIRTYSAW